MENACSIYGSKRRFRIRRLLPTHRTKWLSFSSVSALSLPAPIPESAAAYGAGTFAGSNFINHPFLLYPHCRISQVFPKFFADRSSVVIQR